jgi:hypothetical protein
MTTIGTLIIGAVVSLGAIFGITGATPNVGGGTGTINQLQQFVATTSPVSAITQAVFGKSFRLSGQSTGCAQFDSNGVLTSSGVACGSGGGGSGGGGNSNEIDVFLIGGQSNALGQGNSAQSPIPTADTAFQYYNSTISPANDPVGGAGNYAIGEYTDSPTGGSAWPSFAIEYHRATGRKIAFVPTAVSGSAQTQEAVDAGLISVSWDTTGTLYTNSISKLTSAISSLTSEGYTPVFKGILWAQGETDAICIALASSPCPITATRYREAAETMIENYRNALGSSTPFYIFQTGVAGAGTYAFNDSYRQIRDAQAEIAANDPYTKIVFSNALDFQTRGLIIPTDGSKVHYTQAGYNEMGAIGASNIVSAGANSYLQNSATSSNNIYYSKGYVGIGTTTFPSNLTVQNNYGSKNPMLFTIASSTSSSGASSIGVFNVNKQGRVSIGTTTEAYFLDVSSGGFSAGARFSSTAVYNIFDMTSFNTSGSLQNMLRFQNGASTIWSIGSNQANSNAFTFANSSLLSTTPRVVITTLGNVGIGTTSPESLLDVDGRGTFGTPSASSAQVVIKGGNFGGSMFTLSRTLGAPSQFSFALSGGGLSFSDDTTGIVTANMFGNAGSNELYLGQKGRASFEGRNAILGATTYGTAAGSDIDASNLILQGGLGNGAGTPGDVSILTGTTLGSGTTGQTGTARLTVKGNTGDVGIGTTTPGYRLDVSDGAGTAQARFSGTSPNFNIVDLTAFGTGGAVQNMIRFNSIATTNWAVGVNQANSNALTFGTGSLLSSAPRMVISTGGNVGIGTTTPGTALTVNGTITSTSTPPALSSCGTSPTVVGNNNYGEIVTGATATGCTVTFATAFPTFASCVVTNQSMSLVNAMTYTDSRTGFTVSQTGLGGSRINYKCDGF